jgi:CBS domain-containing protein
MSDCISRVLEHKGAHVETVPRDTTVFAAVERMNERRIGALLVVDNFREGEPYRPIGIFTERDVLVRVIARRLDPQTTTVGEVMTCDPFTIHAATTVAEAMTIITERRCRHLPVVDDVGLCGLISIGDLTSWVVRDQELTIDDLHGYILHA